MKTTNTSAPESLNRRTWFGRVTAASVGAVLGGSVAQAGVVKPASTHVVKRTVAPKGKGPTMPMGFDEGVI
jgi:hypothetical protein